MTLDTSPHALHPRAWVPDPDSVQALWLHLAARYRTRLLDKRRSPLMHAVAWVLGTARVLPKDAFLQQYTTTIGRRIYLAWDPWLVDDSPETAWRSLVLAVHEHQHVAQWERGPVRFVLGYLLSPRRRAELEAEAYGTALELAVWAGRPLPEPRTLAERLRDYACGPRQVAQAARNLEVVAATALSGGPASEAAHVAMTFLSHRRDN